MSRYLASAKTLTFSARTLYDVVDKSGIKLLNVVDQHFSVERPNHLYVRSVREDNMRRQFWFDGEKFSLLDTVKNRYDSVTLKEAIVLDKLFDVLRDRYNLGFPVVDLLYSKPYSSNSGHILSVAYIGKRVINGVSTHHISIESDIADWQIWVKDGDMPVPLRLAVSYVTHAEKPGYITVLSDWQLNAGLNKDRFTFNAPGGATKANLLKRTVGATK
jgi:hypothetical protein